MVYPLHYDLEFEPDLKNFTFRGKESIDVSISKPTNSLLLDAAELKIKNCFIESKEGRFKAKTQLDDKTEQLSIKTPKKISGVVKIVIDYTGILNDRLLGFYRSQYKDSNGKTKYLATTQFEAADARRAFPCWDEPKAKATFDISIIADKGLTAISNMPVISKKKTGKKFHYKFSRTPVMSTYLIYLGVGEFEFLSSKLGKILVRVVTTKGNKSKGKLSLDLAKKFLNYYEKYFKIKYPLPKLDLIAIPDFAAGAMENWGAITFRETILLYDKETSSTKTKQFIAEVISHELAHQWFGNLVTMEWWNDLWLNESFATYMATKIVHEFYPEWDLWDQFLETSMNSAMMLDALKTSHPIDVEVNRPSEIREIFDSISYDKGGCILRMLENYVGKENFQKGLQHYLKKHMYKNAKGESLWKSIGMVSKKPVHLMMNSWIKQVGFPTIDVMQSNSHLVLEQKRFLLESNNKIKKTKWHVPIFQDLQNHSTIKLMTKNNQKIPIGKEKTSLVINNSRKGFYRVKYSQQLLSNIKWLIAKKKLSHVDRWSIQNDLFALCVAGQEKIQTYLNFIEAYYEDKNYLSTLNVANNLNFLFLLTFDQNYSSKIQFYTKQYFKKIFARLGWDKIKNEKHTDALLRSFVIFVLGKLNDKLIVREAQNRFVSYLKNPASLSPDLQETIFSIVAMNGDLKIYSKLEQLYKMAKSQEEKLRFLGAMCSFRNESILQKTLAFSLTEHVRSQNIALPIMRISSNPYGKKLIWPWMKKNWKKLTNKFGYGNPLANRIVSSISLVAKPPMEKEIRQFFKKNPTPGTEMTLEQTLERIRVHGNLLEQMNKEFKISTLIN